MNRSSVLLGFEVFGAPKPPRILRGVGGRRVGVLNTKEKEV